MKTKKVKKVTLASMTANVKKQVRELTEFLAYNDYELC